MRELYIMETLATQATAHNTLSVQSPWDISGSCCGFDIVEYVIPANDCTKNVGLEKGDNSRISKCILETYTNYYILHDLMTNKYLLY